MLVKEMMMRVSSPVTWNLSQIGQIRHRRQWSSSLMDGMLAKKKRMLLSSYIRFITYGFGAKRLGGDNPGLVNKSLA